MTNSSSVRFVQKTLSGNTLVVGTMIIPSVVSAVKDTGSGLLPTQFHMTFRTSLSLFWFPFFFFLGFHRVFYKLGTPTHWLKCFDYLNQNQNPKQGNPELPYGLSWLTYRKVSVLDLRQTENIQQSQWSHESRHLLWTPLEWILRIHVVIVSVFHLLIPLLLSLSSLPLGNT